MLSHQKRIFFLLCFFVSFNSYSGGNEQEEKLWIYQSVLGERVAFRSNGSISMTRHDFTYDGMECPSDNYTLCLQAPEFDIVIPEAITETWDSDYSRYRLLKDKLTISLLGTNIENYIVFESIKKHVSCEKDCGGYAFIYSYQNGLLGFGLRHDDKWAVLYLSDKECNLGGSCLAEQSNK